MLAPLPVGSRIKVEEKNGGYSLQLSVSSARRVIRWFVIAFLVFAVCTCAGIRFLPLDQITGGKSAVTTLLMALLAVPWMLGGLLLGYAALTLALRRNETLLLEPTRLTWKPAYPLMTRSGRNIFPSLKDLFRGRGLRPITFVPREISSFDIVSVRDPDDAEPVDHLVLRCGRNQYELGRDLDEDDLVWLCAALSRWKEQPGMQKVAAR